MGTNWTERRVVVTGLGVVTPIGNDIETFWTASINGSEYEDLECKTLDDAKDWTRDLMIDREHHKDAFKPTVEYFRFYWDHDADERIICESREE